jgi:CO dehydrogenase maturation factor
VSGTVDNRGTAGIIQHAGFFCWREQHKKELLKTSLLIVARNISSKQLFSFHSADNVYYSAGTAQFSLIENQVFLNKQRRQAFRQEKQILSQTDYKFRSSQSDNVLAHRNWYGDQNMSKVIAFAGKGGVGKTTVAALVVRYMAKNGKAPVLAVDADPNSNLGETMGLDVTSTIGEIRETYMKDPQGIPSGMDKVNYLETLVEQALIEKSDFDLLVMGRQEGQGCYCMVNNILNNFTDKLAKHYKYMVVDNEAGMEHLSRRTSGEVDILFLVTDYSLRGLRAVRRINEMLTSLKLKVGKTAIIVTRGPETLSKAFLDEVKEINLPIAAVIPNDPALLEFDMERRSLLELPDDSAAVVAVNSLMSDWCPV